MPESAYLIPTAKLKLNFLNPKRTVVESELSIQRNPQSSPAQIDLVLDGNENILQLDSIEINGQVLQKGKDFDVTKDKLTISNKVFSNEPEPFTLRIKVGIDPDKYQSSTGIFKQGDMLCTQCERDGFRNITYFIDRPDVSAKFSTEITAPAASYSHLLAIGEKMSEEVLNDGAVKQVTWHYETPIPSYLFAFTAGNFQVNNHVFTYQDGKQVDIQIHVTNDLDKCAYGTQCLTNAMRWLDDEFKLKYKHPVLKVVVLNDFIYGGMENPTLIVMNSNKFKATIEETTDRNFYYANRTIAHEFFHYWFGNRIGLKDWQQFALKEGLADFLFYQHVKNPPYKRINYLMQQVPILRKNLFLHLGTDKAVPILKEGEAASKIFAVDVDVMYEKSAAVLTMMHTLLGEDQFRKNIEAFAKDFDGEPSTIDDFLNIMLKSSPHQKQFRLWYTQKGMPQVKAEWRYDVERGVHILQLSQTVPQGELPYVIPVRLSLIAPPDGKIIPNETGENESLVILTGAEQKFEFKTPIQNARFSLMHDFSALARTDFQDLNFENKEVEHSSYPARELSREISTFHQYTPDDLAFLMRHSPNDFARVEASQLLIRRMLEKAIKQQSYEDELKIWRAAVIDILRASQSSEVITQIIVKPEISSILQGKTLGKDEQANMEKEYKQLHKELANNPELKNEMLAGMQRVKNSNDLHDRSLYRELIRCLVRVDAPAYHPLAQTLFHEARSMSDLSEGLAIISEQSDRAAHDKALEHFFTQYRHNDLIVLYGMRTLAQLPYAEGLKWIAKLETDGVFNIDKANQIHALWYTFTTEQFSHLECQQGYKWLTQCIFRLENSIHKDLAIKFAKCLDKCKTKDYENNDLLKALVDLKEKIEPDSPLHPYLDGHIQKCKAAQGLDRSASHIFKTT